VQLTATAKRATWICQLAFARTGVQKGELKTIRWPVDVQYTITQLQHIYAVLRTGMLIVVCECSL